MTDALLIGGREFNSRLFVGTGKFPSNQSLRDALIASGTEMVTVALRRIDPTAGEDILDAEALVLIEWPEHAGVLLPLDHVPILLQHLPGDPTRRLLYAGGHVGEGKFGGHA